jgi:hypothetical protein
VQPARRAKEAVQLVDIGQCRPLRYGRRLLWVGLDTIYASNVTEELTSDLLKAHFDILAYNCCSCSVSNTLFKCSACSSALRQDVT